MRNLVTLLLFIVCSCDYYDNRLRVVNQMDYSIAVEEANDTIPSIVWPNQPEFYYEHAIEAGDTTELMKMGKNSWPIFIERSTNKKLNLFVFRIDSLRKYKSVDTLISHGNYRLYKFSEKELNDNKWTVVLK